MLPRLAAVVGKGTASRLLLGAQTLDAAEAMRVGLFDAVAETGACVALALDWARDVARGAPLAVRELKALLRESTAAFDGVLVGERRRFVASWASDDHREAVEAYFEDRPPVWKGR
jgi:enoyl-CoA hydratase/carnithine racemase